MGSINLPWFVVAASALAVANGLVIDQQQLKPVPLPMKRAGRAFVQVGEMPGQQQMQGLVPPIIEGGMGTGEDASEKTQQMQRIAEIFAKEPESASGLGGQGGDSTDALGLDNDPLEVLGFGEDDVDPDSVQNELAQLRQEVNEAEEQSKKLPEKKKQLESLETKLQEARSKADEKKKKKEELRKKGGNDNQMQTQQQIRDLDQQIKVLESQLANVKSQKDDLQSKLSGGGSGEAESGGSSGGGSSGSGSAAFVERHHRIHKKKRKNKTPKHRSKAMKKISQEIADLISA